MSPRGLVHRGADGERSHVAVKRLHHVPALTDHERELLHDAMALLERRLNPAEHAVFHELKNKLRFTRR